MPTIFNNVQKIEINFGRNWTDGQADLAKIKQTEGLKSFHFLPWEFDLFEIHSYHTFSGTLDEVIVASGKSTTEKKNLTVQTDIKNSLQVYPAAHSI